jgi:hypothetical protein
MARSDYAWTGIPPYDVYAAVVRAGSFPGTESPLLSTANFVALMERCEANDTHWLVPLAWFWEEGHEITAPGLVAASVNNPAGTKWAPGLGFGAYNSGIPADTGGTYAGYPDMGRFFDTFFQTLTNDMIGPYFNAGELERAANAYVNGPQFADRSTDANGTPIERAQRYIEWRERLDAESLGPTAQVGQRT